MAIAEGRKGPAKGGVLDGNEATRLRALLAEQSDGRTASDSGGTVKRAYASLRRKRPMRNACCGRRSPPTAASHPTSSGRRRSDVIFRISCRSRQDSHRTRQYGRYGNDSCGIRAARDEWLESAEGLNVSAKSTPLILVESRSPCSGSSRIGGRLIRSRSQQRFLFCRGIKARWKVAEALRQLNTPRASICVRRSYSIDDGF